VCVSFSEEPESANIERKLSRVPLHWWILEDVLELGLILSNGTIITFILLHHTLKSDTRSSCGLELVDALYYACEDINNAVILS